MRRSTDRILTTHVGSLPAAAPLDRADPDYEQKLRDEVTAVVRRQQAIGLDLVNEGEYAKEGDWLSFLETRLGGFEQRPPAGGRPIIAQGRDREVFAEFYDYAAKYVDEDGARFTLPAQIPREKAEELRALAIRAYKAIDCAGMARVDFFLERGTDRILLNEINTIPGFTKISMYPKLWEASGLPYSELLDELIRLALENFAQRKALRTEK